MLIEVGTAVSTDSGVVFGFRPARRASWFKRLEPSHRGASAAVIEAEPLWRREACLPPLVTGACLAPRRAIFRWNGVRGFPYPYGSPGGLDQHLLQPGRAFLHPRGFPLPGTLVPFRGHSPAHITRCHSMRDQVISDPISFRITWAIVAPAIPNYGCAATVAVLRIEQLKWGLHNSDATFNQVE